METEFGEQINVSHYKDLNIEPRSMSHFTLLAMASAMVHTVQQWTMTRLLHPASVSRRMHSESFG